MFIKELPSKTKAGIREYKSRGERSLHERAWDTLKKAERDIKLQKNLKRTFRDLATANAKIKELEDRHTRSSKAKAAALRSALETKKTACKLALGLKGERNSP